MKTIKSTIRSDLCDRIKERHDLWFKDSIQLYRIARLKPSEAVNDVCTVLSFQLVWLVDYYDGSFDDLVDGLKQTMVNLKAAQADDP